MAESQAVHVTAAAGIPNGTTIETPEGMPNIVVKTRPWWVRTAIRAARIYVVGLTGILPTVLANPGGVLVPLPDFTSALILALQLSIAPAASQLLINLAEWLVREDSR